MLTLSPRDLALFRRLRELGVFEDIDGAKLNQRAGIFCVVCSDCDQFHDIYSLHCSLMLGHRTTLRPHMFADHGKPLWLAHNSPLNKNGRGDNLLHSIGQVPGIKEISTGVLHPHAPCAAATSVGMDILQQVAAVKASKARAQNSFPGLTIANFFQVDNGKKRSYRVNGERWRAFLLETGFSQEDLSCPEVVLEKFLQSPF